MDLNLEVHFDDTQRTTIIGNVVLQGLLHLENLNACSVNNLKKYLASQHGISYSSLVMKKTLKMAMDRNILQNLGSTGKVATYKGLKGSTSTPKRKKSAHRSKCEAALKIRSRQYLGNRPESHENKQNSADPVSKKADNEMTLSSMVIFDVHNTNMHFRKHSTNIREACWEQIDSASGIGSLICNAWNKSATVGNALRGFKVIGNFPFSNNALPDRLFYALSDSEVPVPENMTQEVTNSSSKVLINTPQINLQPAEPRTSSVKPPPTKHLHKISPIPKFSLVTAKNRIKETPVLLTSIYNRDALEANLEKRFQKCKKIKKDDKTIKKKFNFESGGGSHDSSSDIDEC
ncbi:hypothetical protein AVEN_118572-1 [Araneus ventricosus]|uniref:H15 domain-containing protein n=1 Tax=Araneus ventricosus TaxID=182803 RepID=A0A4Y2AZ73_ARAVE|nr:hypothetical protein AVEN_118572-1 [Araneus ventricosus]